MDTKVVKFVSTLYSEDGTSRPVVPDNGVHFELEELYRLLETDMIQVVYLSNKHIMVIDMEGKLKDKNFNREATSLFLKSPHIPGDYIVGKALVCLDMQMR
jgi:hypothetical protein